LKALRGRIARSHIPRLAMIAPSLRPLENRVALVTGSTTGLGKEMALALGLAGAKVAINYQNNAERAQKAFAEIRAKGIDAALIRGDVTDQCEVPRMVAEIGEQLGPVDILVLNATADQPQKKIEDYDWAFYQQMLDFFVKSPFLLSKACIPHMKAQRWGRIINIGSEVFTKGVAPFTAYVAAKGGQNGFNRSLATELAPWGITVNMISPGWIPVERHAQDPEELKENYLKLIPMGRWGVPEDVAGAVVFLASQAASFITGQNLHINGGTTVH
jgi:3-oxoacyl-[acyl-carrier protein] reductase